MRYNLKVNFNTLAGPIEVVFTPDQIKGSDLGRIYESLLSQVSWGVIGGTYELPHYPSRVELNLVKVEVNHDHVK